jgi:hypothetical protein
MTAAKGGETPKNKPKRNKSRKKKGREGRRER